MVIGAVLAGGVGQRMGAALPKQFLPLGDQPILVQTLRVFLACPRMDAVLVAVPAAWLDYTADILRERSMRERVTLIEGGETRTETLCRVMDAAAALDPDAILVTHDAVRPFIDGQLLEDNIDAAVRDGACGTAIPLVDSLIRSAGGKRIDEMPDRGQYFRMQTPQSFRLPILRRAFAALTATQKEALTDGCNICVLAGVPVTMVPGREQNIKITTAADYRLALRIEEDFDR